MLVIAKQPPNVAGAEGRSSLTICISAGIPDPVDQLIIAVEVSSIVLHILRWGSRKVHRETCELDITCPIVDNTQISETTPCVLAVNCVSPCTFTDWKISRVFFLSARVS